MGHDSHGAGWDRIDPPLPLPEVAMVVAAGDVAVVHPMAAGMGQLWRALMQTHAHCQHQMLGTTPLLHLRDYDAFILQERDCP